MKSNAYNFSNDLARIGSALSKAMLGSASDDANIALGKYRDAQTEGQNLKNRGMSGNLDAINAAAQGNILPRRVANALGYDVNNGNLIQPVLPGEPQMSVPAFGADQVNMDSGALMTELSNIARSMYGDGTSNANQLSQMVNNIAAAGSNRLAESMILRGTDDQAGRGALMLNPAGGKFQNPKNAVADIANTLTAALDKNQTTLTGKKDETEAKFGEGGQGDRDNTRDNQTTKALGLDLTDAKERWNNFKANKELEASKYGDDVQAGVDRDKNKAADATVRYRHDNRTVEFTVEPGKLLVIDPVSAKKAKIPIQTGGEYKGLYILDGGEKPGAVQVKVGKGDVYMDEATADALGIDQNDDGQFVIKGAGFKDSSSSDGSGSGSGDEDSLDLQRYNKEWRDTVQFYPAFADVPNHAESAMKKIITEQIKKDMKPVADGGRGMDYTTAYASNADVTIGAGAYKVTEGTNFFVPKYYFDAFVSGNQKNDPETRVISFFRSNLGYSQDQAKRVAKEILAARG